jgi:uncharacterized protein (TIGR03086 family)
MVWEADAVYLKGLDLFSAVVNQFPPGEWEAASPCAGWRALDVLGHVGVATWYGIELLAGRAPDWKPLERPGDGVEGEPTAWWAGLAGKVRELTRAVDLSKEIDTAAGRRSIRDGLSFPAVDLFIHAWDLGRCVGIDVEIPPDVVEFAHSVLGMVPDAQLRSHRVFASEAIVPPGATPTEEFIAWTGREPRWSPM